MATPRKIPRMQKFKLLATQCAVSGSPTRSPSGSPVIHVRRRKTLRMLLSGTGNGRMTQQPENEEGGSPEKGKRVRHKQLKDLFVSSPPGFGGRLLSDDHGLIPARRGGPTRPMSATFRQRLLRRAWRPVLVAIPE